MCALAPENTWTSFILAARKGLEWIEFDIRLTKDNELIIFHDDSLERTSNGKGLVHEHSLSYIRKLDAGSWFDPIFSHEKIPIFSEIAPKLRDQHLTMNIELKAPNDLGDTQLNHYEEVLVTKLVNFFKKSWPSEAPFPLISSFHWSMLERVRKQFPKAPIGFLEDECSIELIEKVKKTPNSALHCHYKSLNDKLLELTNKYEIPVLVYTVNDYVMAKKLLDKGVFGVFTDALPAQEKT